MKASAPSIEIPVIVVVPPRVLLLDLAGPIEVLRKANLEQDRVRFTVTHAGPSPTVESSVGMEIAGIVPLPEDLPDGALIVLPGSADEPFRRRPGNLADDMAAEEAIVRWLRRAVRPGIRLISICAGALLAARAGLLDGYDCTTHHVCVAELAQLAPAARVRENRLYVEDGERLTSAGVTAGIDLMLYLVAQWAGDGCAVAVARYLVVYLRRAGGDPQLSPWLEGRNHIHPAVHRAQDAVTVDPTRHWSVETLARAAAVSPRHLSRLFNEYAGMNVADYVNRVRIARARELLTSSRLDIETVAERVGFGSSRQLRRAWGRLNRLPPSRARLESGKSALSEINPSAGFRASPWLGTDCARRYENVVASRQVPLSGCSRGS